MYNDGLKKSDRLRYPPISKETASAAAIGNTTNAKADNTLATTTEVRNKAKAHERRLLYKCGVDAPNSNV